MNVYASGWCTVCGRRRGADGRCVNCDPWWTSPLIQVGGPILAVGSLLLVGLAVAVTPPHRDTPASSAASRPPRPSAAIFTPPTVSGSSIASAGPLSAPPLQAAPPPLAPMPQLPPDFYAPKPDPDAAMMESFEWLRYSVRVASNQMRTRSEMQARPYFRNNSPISGPQTLNFAESATQAL
ncbi:hypothetical protein [Armatimonas sp.]|uniref:hypothetical protein n=1 Tax=Armatimonas sp. TaxID=1872638 RepID=UPI00286BEFDE|nr:hypothetical protein [Armatimonas sp.]